jgi:hypothetical protein
MGYRQCPVVGLGHSDDDYEGGPRGFAPAGGGQQQPWMHPGQGADQVMQVGMLGAV